MIVDRYPPKRLFRIVPDLPQAFAPELAQLDRLLEDDAIFCRVKADMARRRPHSLTLGRPGTPVEVVLRLLVLKRLHGWSDEQVEHFVSGSLVLRQFCRAQFAFAVGVGCAAARSQVFAALGSGARSRVRRQPR
jgi:transposase, IS5 family